uniref:Uncharacterized protein n=1 Tax=Coniophora olivacea TaxID=85977 RepID=A0A896Z6D4_9AGAM
MKISLFYFFIYFPVLQLAILAFFFFNFKISLLGESSKTFCTAKFLLDSLLLVSMFLGMLYITIEFLCIIYSFTLDSGFTGQLWMSENTNQQDPVRTMPSGVLETWFIFGFALAAYKIFTTKTPGFRVLISLASLCVTLPLTIYCHALRNPEGFDRLMYSITTFISTGQWPNPNFYSPSNSVLTQIHREVSNGISSFLPSFDWFNIIINYLNSSANGLLDFILKIFQPVAVEGHLDILLGQQLLIHFLSVIVVISLIVLCIVYFCTIFMLKNKDFLLKKFNNRFILFYLNYQVFLARLTTVILPFLILLGLVELLIMLHFLITHPIPIEQLPIDLHTYLKKR